MIAILQDGEGCSVGVPENRLTNLTFTCNEAADMPSIVNAVEGPQCTYIITIETDLVCGAAFQIPLPSSSSSSSALPPPVLASSSSASSVSPTGGSTGPAGVLGDPQFMGLRGQSFQVHGIDGAVYNLIVDHGMLVNALFTYRASGRCPAVAEATNCWSHPGSYLGAVGVVSADGARLHVVSGGWDEGFSSVTLNSEPLSVGAMSTGGLHVSLLSGYALRVRAGNFELLLENSDRFVNIVETRVLQWAQLASHGLLGQTWHKPAQSANRRIPYIEGEVDDYVEQNNDIFGSALMYGVDGADYAE